MNLLEIEMMLLISTSRATLATYKNKIRSENGRIFWFYVNPF